MRFLASTLVLSGGLLLTSCNGLRVYVSKAVPPDFSFGAGQFAECCTDFRKFAVFEEESQTPVWRIAADRTIERAEARSLTIHYGKVPDRFRQEVPNSGEPPQLIEGKRYQAVAGWTGYVPAARVRFTVRNNQIEELPEQPGDNP